MASAQVCPVIGTTSTVLPPDHPALPSDPEARCPVVNAKVGHHDSHIIHNHPSSPTIPDDKHAAMDARSCPAVKSAMQTQDLTDAVCPVVGPVNAHLPPQHPKLKEKDAGTVCPVTNATLDHHHGKVAEHPGVPEDAPVQKCPVAGSMVGA